MSSCVLSSYLYVCTSTYLCRKDVCVCACRSSTVISTVVISVRKKEDLDINTFIRVYLYVCGRDVEIVVLVLGSFGSFGSSRRLLLLFCPSWSQ